MSEWKPVEPLEFIPDTRHGYKVNVVQEDDCLIIAKGGTATSIRLPDDIRLCRRVPNDADLLSACESALAMLDTLFPADVFTGESGDPGAVLIAQNRVRLRKAVEKAKGE